MGLAERRAVRIAGPPWVIPKRSVGSELPSRSHVKVLEIGGLTSVHVPAMESSMALTPRSRSLWMPF